MDSENINNKTKRPDTLRENERYQCEENEKKESPVLERKITSWETYNFLLRELVDQLIDLGASKEIKIVAFKLWASYLQLINVAFISKDKKQLPALPLNFRNKDVKALYGIENLRRKVFTVKRKHTEIEIESSSLCEGVTASQMRNETEPKKKKSNYVTDSIKTSNTEASNQFKGKKKILFRSSASKVLKEISQITKFSHSIVRQKMDEKVLSKITRLANDRRYCSRKIYPPMPLTMITLITIVRVALQLVGDEIFLGDILRWISEGRISFNNYKRSILFRNLNIKNELLPTKRAAFMLDIRNFTHHLKLKSLPTPNLFHLAERYCKELNLPNEFCQVVLKLMVDGNVTMDYSAYSFRIFPDYECRVMAFIIYVFKLIFSLDDVTEHHLSLFIDVVNDIRSNNDAAGDISVLFSWRKWVQFIECRKANLSKHNVSINNMSYNGTVANSNVFLNYWEKMESPYQVTSNSIDTRLLSSLREECCSLSQENEEINLNYPVSFTPFKTYIEYLMVNHPELLRSRSRKILSQDFSQCKINFGKKWCLKIAHQLNLNVEMITPITYFDKKIYNYQYFKLLASSKTQIPRADVPVSVVIDREKPAEMISNSEEIIASRTAVDKFCSPEEYENTVFKIFNPLHYWCFHEFHKIMTAEEFEEVAVVNFPRSFLWLLRECASMLSVSVKELYFELIFVEIMMRQVDSENFQKRVPLKIYVNEW